MPIQMRNAGISAAVGLLDTFGDEIDARFTPKATKETRRASVIVKLAELGLGYWLGRSKSTSRYKEDAAQVFYSAIPNGIVAVKDVVKELTGKGTMTSGSLVLRKVGSTGTQLGNELQPDLF